jgi:hypothetical protein
MNIRDYLDIGLGEVLGLLTAIAIVVVVIYRRFRALSSIDFKLDPPDIPRIILVSIKTAEAEYYGSQALWRRAAEALQDLITFLSPGLVYKLYSGYMGAGGDWDGWKASLTPGAESRRRFQYEPQDGGYKLIERLRE